MSIKIDQNGVPSIVALESTTPGQAIGANIISPTVASTTYGSLAGSLLAEFDSAAVIIIDPNSRSVYGISGAAAQAMANAATAVTDAQVDITPAAGQTGKSLEWDCDDGLDAMTQPVQDAINGAVAAAKPKRTVQSLVSSLLSPTFATDVAPIVIIDQANGKVTVAEPTSTSAVETAIDALTNAGDRVKIKLSEPPTMTSNPSIFEGGATS